MTPGEIVLKIDGLDWRGWESVEFERAIDRAATAFQLSVTEKWAGQKARRPILPGGEYELLLDGEKVAAGYIDAVAVDYDTASHTIRPQARDRVGDVVDCAAVVDGDHEWYGLTLTEIAARLCKPYGVAVRADVDVGAPIARFAIQPGEAAWDAIERAARFRAVLPTSDGLGTLVLTRAGRAGHIGGALMLGRHIKQASATFSNTERHSLVVVRGQQEATDDLDGLAQTQPEGRAHDRGIARWRPTVIIAEAAGDGASFSERAAWRVRVARGRGLSVTYTVPGWRDPDGALWQPNRIINIVDAYLDQDGERLISAVRLRHSLHGGTEAELTVAPVDAFDLLPDPEPEPEEPGYWGEVQ